MAEITKKWVCKNCGFDRFYSKTEEEGIVMEDNDGEPFPESLYPTPQYSLEEYRCSHCCTYIEPNEDFLKLVKVKGEINE